MEITGIDRAAPGVYTPSPVAPVDTQAQSREVVQAVKALNGSEMFGEENELRFQRDPQTQRMVLRLVNRRTSEVVEQIPPEYVLRLSRGMKQA
ncbi:MAG: flagellar protein FlaG [Acidobacteriota bacterium]|nr:flagellar protein FlaG [Acidobacteriota bacterium]